MQLIYVVANMQEIKMAVADGAKEIDIVINRFFCVMRKSKQVLMTEP